MAEADVGRCVEEVRRFNRFYTQKVGVLHEGLLGSPFSLTEVRVLYEVANREGPTASELARELGLDAGYLSRILRGFERRGLIERRPSESDGRQSLLLLTDEGREIFAPLDARSRDEVGGALASLGASDRERLVEAMRTIEQLLGGRPAPAVPYILRPHRPGDIGWVVHRHGVLYSREYGWDERFEGLVAGVAADFVRRFDPKRERCWIAEREGRNVGSVFLVKKAKTVAQLRMLLVEPEARGLGIGSRLVAECESFARQAGYRKIVLWTNSVLLSARRIYQAAGYRLVREEPHDVNGLRLVGEVWELVLK
jgi:DNA-binding MarR family transcriptional regulator/GNAT superfamily N-acetyltransferase